MEDETWCDEDEQSSGRHLIHLAAIEGDIAALEVALANEPDALELLDWNACTPLHCAVSNDKADAVRFLLNKGANATSEGGNFSRNGGSGDCNDAVTMAAVLGCMGSLEALLESDIEVPMQALVKAAGVNQDETVRLMVTRLRAYPRDFSNQDLQDGIEQALVSAAKCWHVETVQFLVGEIKDVSNLQQEEDHAALNRALHVALEDTPDLCADFCRDRYARQRQFLVVQDLVAAGANLSEHSIWCALHPLDTGHDEIARDLGLLLIAQGVDVTVTDNEGRTPLAVASRDNDDVDDNSLVAALLVLAAGSTISTDNYGNTPLHYVRQPSIAKLLLDHGAVATSRNNMGWTPLISVAGAIGWCQQTQPGNHVEVCRLLLSYGAEINASAKDGLTALHRAVASEDSAVTSFLLEQGADIALVTKTGQSVLHCACKAVANPSDNWSCDDSENLGIASMEILRMLLDHGADPEAQDAEGRTPLFYMLSGYIKEPRIQGMGDWVCDGAFHSAEDNLYWIHPEAYDACELMVQRGANPYAKDKDGNIFRDLIKRKTLERPLLGLQPEVPIATPHLAKAETVESVEKPMAALEEAEVEAEAEAEAHFESL